MWSEGDVEFAHEFFATTYRENDRQRTPDGHARGAREFREHFADFRTEVIGMLDFGDAVLSRVRFRGTYAGGWAGVDSVGTAVEVSGVDAFHFKDELVVDHWHEADHALMWEQLGVSLPPGWRSSRRRTRAPSANQETARCLPVHVLGASREAG